MEATRAGKRDGAREPRARPETADRLDLGQLLTFYTQQNSAVNQLWTMYAVTAFTASLFAFDVGKERPDWVLLAGLAGFVVFTLGHAGMVWGATRRLQLAAADIAVLRGDRPISGHPQVVGYIARRHWVWTPMLVHFLIDLCVFAAFARFYWPG